MTALLTLTDLDADPGRRFTAARDDLPRLVGRLRHRGFATVTPCVDKTTVTVTGRHRLSGAVLELTLLPARSGERQARLWDVVVRHRDGSVTLTDLWVGTRYRWRTLDEADPVGLVAKTAERLAAGRGHRRVPARRPGR